MESQAIWEGIQFLETRPLNELLSEVVIKVCSVSDTPNRNDTVINREVGLKIAATLPGSPIVGYFSQSIGDFEEHNEISSWDGKKIVTTPLTQPYGFVSLDQPWYQDFIENGIRRTYIMCRGFLWTRQFAEARIIPDKGQSIELDDVNFDGYFEGENFIFTDAVASKLCILGDNYEPCFSGAKFLSNHDYYYTRYTKKTEDFVTELENILGRRYCVVDGKLTEKTPEGVNSTQVIDQGHQPKEDEKNKPATAYSNVSGTATGEGNGEGEPTGDPAPVPATEPVAESASEPANQGAEGVGENVNVDPAKIPAESSKPNDDNVAGNDGVEDYVGEKGIAGLKGPDQANTGCPVGEPGEPGVLEKDPHNLPGDPGEPGEPGGTQEPEIPVDPSDPDHPDNIIKTSPSKGSDAKKLTAEAMAATAAAEKDKQTAGAAIDSNVTDVKPGTTFSLSDPEPDQIPSGTTVTIPSQKVVMPTADGISVEVNTTGPNYPATPEVEDPLNVGNLKALIDAAVAKVLADNSQTVDQTAAGAKISETAAQIDAAQDGTLATIPSPTAQQVSVPSSSDSAMSIENNQLKETVAALEAEIEGLKVIIGRYTEMEQKMEAERKQALINDYIKLLGEEEIGSLKTKYSAMSYEDTENLLSLTYARKQREKIKAGGATANLQLNIGSLLPQSDGTNDLPGFMKQALKIEGQLTSI